LFYVLKESFKVYKAVSEGLINLADKFFDMDYFNAQRALEIYKESILSAERLQVLPCSKQLCYLCPALLSNVVATSGFDLSEGKPASSLRRSRQLHLQTSSGSHVASWNVSVLTFMPLRSTS